MFVDGLLNADPPIINQENLQSFISEVFGNVSAISSHHHRMLGALLSRQREQHPLVQSVTDIILDSQYDVPGPFFHTTLRHAYQPHFSSAPITKHISRATLSPKLDIDLSSRRTQAIGNGCNGVTSTLEYGNET